MRHAFVLLAILTFVPLAGSAAQVQQPPVKRGARVRVTTSPPNPCPAWNTRCLREIDSRRYVGTFVAWKGDTLVVETKGYTLALPLDSVTKLDVSRGRKTNTGEGAVIGLLVGGVVGAVIGYASYEECVGGWACFGDLGPGVNVAAGGVIGGLGGLVAGAFIGLAIETDRWQEVPLDRLRVSLGPQRDGRFGFGASVKF